MAGLEGQVRIRGGMEPVNLFELEAIAREKLARESYDYYASGAQDEVTLRENRAAYDRLTLAYRVLVDVSRRDLATTVLGQPVAMPIVVAPTAFHRLATPEGELATARAAGAAGTVMILSTLSNTRVEEVVAAATGPVWFQLYVYRDREATEGLVRRAEAAGCRALVLTVDAPLLGPARARRAQPLQPAAGSHGGQPAAGGLRRGAAGRRATRASRPTSPRCSIRR